MVQRVQRCYSWFMFEVAVAGVVEDVSLLLLVMSSVLRDRIAQCTSQQWVADLNALRATNYVPISKPHMGWSHSHWAVEQCGVSYIVRIDSLVTR